MATEIKDGMYTNLPTPWAGDFTGTYQTRESTVRSAGHGRSANVYLVLSASQKRWAVGLQTKNRLWADFGNFHFGAVGYAACIPAEILHMAAGAAQWKAGTSRKEWGNFMQGPPFGDDPIDQFWIKQGIDYAKQHHF